MGDRGTFKSGDSMSSHSKDSMAILTNIVIKSKALWVGINTDSSTKMLIDIPYKDFMYAIEHIRETIEEWEVMCDELDDDIYELRKTLEALAGNCPYRDKYCDVTDCAECEHARISVLARQQNELEVQRDIIKDRENIIESLRSELKTLKKRLEAVREDEKHWYEVAKERTNELTDITAAKIKETNRLKNQIADLTEERDYYQDCLHKLANRASNFCGNCAYCHSHPDDTFTCEWRPNCIDPDDASCPHFKSNQTDRVVIGKPEFPCCEHCSHEDCDDCTLCPF